MMKSTNTSSTASKPEYVKFENITEAELSPRPEFFTSMANNPLQGRLDGTSVRQNYLKVIDVKEGNIDTYLTGAGLYNYYGYEMKIPYSTIANYKYGADLVVTGWSEDGGGAGAKLSMGYVGFIFPGGGASNYLNSLCYYLGKDDIVIQLNVGYVTATNVKYKFFIMSY